MHVNIGITVAEKLSLDVEERQYIFSFLINSRKKLFAKEARKTKSSVVLSFVPASRISPYKFLLEDKAITSHIGPVLQQQNAYALLTHEYKQKYHPSHLAFHVSGPPGTNGTYSLCCRC